MGDYYDSSLYKMVREATPEDDEWCVNPYCTRQTAKYFFIHIPDGDNAQEFGMCEECARNAGMPLPPEPFDWEWIGYCQYPVFDSSVPEYESDCREPAVARGYWGDDTDGWLLCQEHLNKILKEQEES
jgi:hypothetical protein